MAQIHQIFIISSNYVAKSIEVRRFIYFKSYQCVLYLGFFFFSWIINSHFGYIRQLVQGNTRLIQPSHSMLEVPSSVCASLKFCNFSQQSSSCQHCREIYIVKLEFFLAISHEPNQTKPNQKKILSKSVLSSLHLNSGQQSNHQAVLNKCIQLQMSPLIHTYPMIPTLVISTKSSPPLHS